MSFEHSLKFLLAALLATTLASACSNKGDDDDDDIVANDDDATADDDDVTANDDDVTSDDDDDDMTANDDDVTSDDDDDTEEPCGDGYCLDEEDCSSCPDDCGDCTDPANGCADGSTEQAFADNMVGCSASVRWNESPTVCGTGWAVCAPTDWVARRGEDAPDYHYWTASQLNYDGDDGACLVSATNGSGCGGYDAMLVCNENYEDSLGNQCNWHGCGLDDTTVNDHFGGCNNESGAGVICCLDPAPAVAGDGLCDAREIGNVEECPPVCGDGVCGDDEDCSTCSNDCGDCCGDGVCDAEVENCSTCQEDCGACCGDGVCGLNDSCSVCPADCGVCPDPASPCADGAPDDSFSGSMAGCAGLVTYDSRDNLCGPNFTACTAQQWMDNRGGTAPTHNYWTADQLRYGGSGSGSCWVSLTEGTFCGEESPMRVCASHTDAEGNVCNWQNCGYETDDPKLNFGGCSGNMTAGTLCCPK